MTNRIYMSEQLLRNPPEDKLLNKRKRQRAFLFCTTTSNLQNPQTTVSHCNSNIKQKNSLKTRFQERTKKSMDNNMAMAEAQQPPPPAAAVQLTELVFSLEQATLMAKQLPATSDPTYVFQIHSSLRQAHHSLSSFLGAAQTQFHVPPPQPSLQPVAAENSLSSATGAAKEDGGEPMQVGDENEAEAEENSKTSIDKVEERMRECFIKNKRAKRQLSPSSAVAAEERRICEDRFVGGVNGSDPLGDKLRALDLVYQFHG